MQMKVNVFVNANLNSPNKLLLFVSLCLTHFLSDQVTNAQHEIEEFMCAVLNTAQTAQAHAMYHYILVLRTKTNNTHIFNI